jgi:hypothetical protein
LTQTELVNFSNHVGATNFSDIQVGQWSLAIQLFDGNGAELYRGVGAASVILNQTTTALVTLDPTGNIQITVDVPNPLIDNFDNDNSWAQADGQRDADWGVSDPQHYTLAMAANIKGNLTPCLHVTYNKIPGEEWSLIWAGRLMADGKKHDLTNSRTITIRVAGSAPVLLKLQDDSGNETGDFPIQSSSDPNGWSTLTFDLNSVNWNLCNRSRVNVVFLFIQPGTTGSGDIYLDDLMANE